MDTAEADLDAKLYKASADLISELQVKLPLLIWHDGDTKQRLRTHVPYSKATELSYILDRFQEWPQLLDPVLASLLDSINKGYTKFVTVCPEAYLYPISSSMESTEVVPLPAALSLLLYTFCKVRGYKVIVRLLSNEPKYVEPMLSSYQSWSSVKSTSPGLGMTWQVEYIMLLWLSHLMLAPFQLSTLSASVGTDFLGRPELEVVMKDLPFAARDVIAVAAESLNSPSKERESAVILLVRLAFRRDLQVHDLVGRLVNYSGRCLRLITDGSRTVYHTIGHLSLLYSIVNLGTNSEVEPFLSNMFQMALRFATGDRPEDKSIRESAPARKLLIKILRVCLVQAIALTHTQIRPFDNNLNGWLEESIQFFLEALGDKDNPVRMAASKALSIVALRLDAAMAAEIVEAVLGGLSENVLLEDPATRTLLAKTELPTSESTAYDRNLTAVDPLRWHGLMLTLGHLLFRRSPPSYQLPDIIEALLLGLDFEQRSQVGTSIGVAVRDAACFGIWALARKYATSDLESIQLSQVAGITDRSISKTSTQSVLQLIANRLLVSACLDPSGNIRRGSSAALQELIGRHPDTISNGISVVQVVDYTAVARRSRAMVEVAIQAAMLDTVYHAEMIDALIGWRGAKAADADSRRWASGAMRLALISTQLPQKLALFAELTEDLYKLGARNLGVTAGARHGLLLCSAALIDSVLSSSSLHAQQVLILVRSIDVTKLTGSLSGRVTSDSDLVTEAVSVFIEAVAQLQSVIGDGSESENPGVGNELLPTIDYCVVTSDSSTSVDASTRAIVAVFQLLSVSDQTSLIERWLDRKAQKQAVWACKGRLNALGSLHAEVEGERERSNILEFLESFVQDTVPIEVRVAAMESICQLLLCLKSPTWSSIEGLSDTIITGLCDYTNDQRGDVGSLLRLQSLAAVEALCSWEGANEAKLEERLAPHVVKLAAEKLNKVRYRAWRCLQQIQHVDIRKSNLFANLEDVNTEEYFGTLLGLSREANCQTAAIRGICSSMGASDDISRASCAALGTTLLGMAWTARTKFAWMVVDIMLSHLRSVSTGDDRHVIPVLDSLSFVLGQDIGIDDCNEINGVNLLATVQKVAESGASVERTNAVGRLYAAMHHAELASTSALDKLTRQLLHRYPKVRNRAADVLYSIYPIDSLLSVDWNRPAAENKPLVLNLRKTVGVVKAKA